MEETLIESFVRDVLLFRSRTRYYRRAGRWLWAYATAILASLLMDNL